MPELRILLLDTETNGLPKNKYAPVSEFTQFPAILQLSWAVYTLTDSHNFMHPGPKKDIGLALDPSIPWDTGAAAIHGITETEGRHGTHALNALLELGRMLRSVHVVVAHNLAFDKPVIRAAAYAEASRQEEAMIGDALRNLWPSSIKEFCTMSKTKDLVRLPATAKQAQHPSLGAYKAPKLNELYAWIYGHPYDISGATLHSAKSDVDCLSRCIIGLLKQGHICVSETLGLSLTSALATNSK